MLPPMMADGADRPSGLSHRPDIHRVDIYRAGRRVPPVSHVIVTGNTAFAHYIVGGGTGGKAIL
jgi:hypothetical protein